MSEAGTRSKIPWRCDRKSLGAPMAVFANEHFRLQRACTVELGSIFRDPGVSWTGLGFVQLGVCGVRVLHGLERRGGRLRGILPRLKEFYSLFKLNLCCRHLLVRRFSEVFR